MIRGRFSTHFVKLTWRDVIPNKRRHTKRVAKYKQQQTLQ